MRKSIQYLECGLLGAVHALAPRNWTTGTIECQANSLGCCCCLYVQSMEARARQPEERLKCQGFDWITRPSFHPPSLRAEHTFGARFETFRALYGRVFRTFSLCTEMCNYSWIPFSSDAAAAFNSVKVLQHAANGRTLAKSGGSGNDGCDAIALQ